MELDEIFAAKISALKEQFGPKERETMAGALGYDSYQAWERFQYTLFADRVHMLAEHFQIPLTDAATAKAICPDCEQSLRHASGCARLGSGLEGFNLIFPER